MALTTGGASALATFATVAASTGTAVYEGKQAEKQAEKSLGQQRQAEKKATSQAVSSKIESQIEANKTNQKQADISSAIASMADLGIGGTDLGGKKRRDSQTARTTLLGE